MSKRQTSHEVKNKKKEKDSSNTPSPDPIPILMVLISVDRSPGATEKKEMTKRDREIRSQKNGKTRQADRPIFLLTI